MNNERCERCHSNMPLCDQTVIDTALKDLPDWSYDATHACIKKCYQFKGYYGAMAFANAVAFIAQQQKHHPDMQITYNQVVVSYQTHEAGGITDNDLLCARLVEALQPR